MDIPLPEQPDGHFDPTDELSPEEVDECKKRVEEELARNNDQELNLEKSEIRVPGQEWAVVSFVGEELSQKTKELGMKIWGCFDSYKNAKEHAGKIHKLKAEEIFDIYVLEMYCWGMIPPKKEYINDQVYHDEKLHEIITEHKRQHNLSKEVFETRKTKLMSNQDKNEYNLRKKEIEDSMMESPALVGGEVHKQVFGEPDVLPLCEVLDPDGKVVSTAQKLSETDEEFEQRLAALKVIGEDSEHASKFYN